MSPELLAALSLLLILSFVTVMLVASRGRSLDSLKLDIRAGEQLVDELSVRGRVSRRRLVATTHRVILQELHWFLARTRTTSLPVHDLDGARLEHRMDPWMLLAGIVLFGLVSPLGLLLVLYALAATHYRLVFGTRNHRLAFAVDGGADQATAVLGFFRGVQRQRELTRGAPDLNTPLLDPPSPLAVRVVAREAWLGVLVMMLAASIQRGLTGGVDLDLAPFLAVYSAVPALVGARTDGRSGTLTGFFGLLGVVTVLFPLPYVQLGAVGAEAPVSAYLVAALVAGAIGGLAGGPRSSGAAVLAAVAATAGWFLVAVVADASSAWTVGQAASVALAGSMTSLAVGWGRTARMRGSDDTDDDTAVSAPLPDHDPVAAR